eukprot:m.54107 g.54107  ORF g.54107 m.54107 type:complete len:68 (+) comp15477_c0_seq1:166-369(+)
MLISVESQGCSQFWFHIWLVYFLVSICTTAFATIQQEIQRLKLHTSFFGFTELCSSGRRILCGTLEQ